MTLQGTMLSRIEGWAKSNGGDAAIHDRNPDGTWANTTWAGYWASIRRVGKGLMALGLQPEDCVAIVGANRRDWVICQHGINAAQGIPAPLYTTLLPEQMAYIVGNAQAKVVICDDQTQLDKYISIAKGDTTIEHIVTMDDLGSSDPRVITLAALMEKGDSVDDAELDARLAAVQMDDVALLVYTSGTTGLPKGAMLTHRGIDLIANAVAEVFPSLLETKTRNVSYLPLCHAAEQGMTNFAGLMVQAETYYCGDLTQIKDYLAEVHPTIFLAVPRVWEKFEAALRGKLAEATGIKAKLASWARQTELEAFKQEAATGRPVSSFSRNLANKLVISKIKDALGLDQLQVALSGAAPISVSTLEFFASIGLPIHEGYGMTETTAFASVQPYGKLRLGTIGKPLPGVEAMIADDGEIMLRGINMVKGYLRLPDKTAELYNEEGWMHTGDLGAIDEDGYISITGRKKDLIVPASDSRRRTGRGRRRQAAVSVGVDRARPGGAARARSGLADFRFERRRDGRPEPRREALHRGGDARALQLQGRPLPDDQEDPDSSDRLQRRRRRADTHPQSETQHREREVRERDRGVLRGGPAGRRVRPSVIA
jgi:long-chain acyl-CoA synthetase